MAVNTLDVAKKPNYFTDHVTSILIHLKGSSKAAYKKKKKKAHKLKMNVLYKLLNSMTGKIVQA